MTVRNETMQELDAVMEGLDEYIHHHDATRSRTFTKAVEDEDVDMEEDDAFPSTLAGLAAFAQSAEMRDLLRDDPAAFRTKYLDFVLGRELVAKGLVTAQQVGAWSHMLSQLPGRRTQQGEVRKAVQHADVQAAPWEYELTERGLQGFLASAQMRQLQRERPSLYRRLYLDFYASMQPAPTPQAISAKRIELELLYPDDPTRSVVAKSLSPLTQGQSVLTANFGPAFGDPSVWLRSR